MDFDEISLEHMQAVYEWVVINADAYGQMPFKCNTLRPKYRLLMDFSLVRAHQKPQSGYALQVYNLYCCGTQL